jgi:hypothetical protein
MSETHKFSAMNKYLPQFELGKRESYTDQGYANRELNYNTTRTLTGRTAMWHNIILPEMVDGSIPEFKVLAIPENDTNPKPRFKMYFLGQKKGGEYSCLTAFLSSKSKKLVNLTRYINAFLHILKGLGLCQNRENRENRDLTSNTIISNDLGKKFDKLFTICNDLKETVSNPLKIKLINIIISLLVLQMNLHRNNHVLDKSWGYDKVIINLPTYNAYGKGKNKSILLYEQETYPIHSCQSPDKLLNIYKYLASHDGNNVDAIDDDLAIYEEIYKELIDKLNAEMVKNPSLSKIDSLPSVSRQSSATSSIVGGRKSRKLKNNKKTRKYKNKKSKKSKSKK